MDTRVGALYSEVFKASLADAEQFWSEAAADIHWTRTWDRVLDCLLYTSPSPRD